MVGEVLLGRGADLARPRRVAALAVRTARDTRVVLEVVALLAALADRPVGRALVAVRVGADVDARVVGTNHTRVPVLRVARHTEVGRALAPGTLRPARGAGEVALQVVPVGALLAVLLVGVRHTVVDALDAHGGALEVVAGLARLAAAVVVLLAVVNVPVADVVERVVARLARLALRRGLANGAVVNRRAGHALRVVPVVPGLALRAAVSRAALLALGNQTGDALGLVQAVANLTGRARERLVILRAVLLRREGRTRLPVKLVLPVADVTLRRVGGAVVAPSNSALQTLGAVGREAHAKLTLAALGGAGVMDTVGDELLARRRGRRVVGLVTLVTARRGAVRAMRVGAVNALAVHRHVMVDAVDTALALEAFTAVLGDGLASAVNNHEALRTQGAAPFGLGDAVFQNFLEVDALPILQDVVLNAHRAGRRTGGATVAKRRRTGRVGLLSKDSDKQKNEHTFQFTQQLVFIRKIQRDTNVDDSEE